MTQVKFFTEIETMLQENDILDIRITKNSGILVVMVTPKINGKTANPIMKGEGWELDEHFIEELNKPVEKMHSFTSNAAEVEIKDAEKEDKPKKETKAEPKKEAEKTGKRKYKQRAKKGDSASADASTDGDDDDEEEEENESDEETTTDNTAESETEADQNAATPAEPVQTGPTPEEIAAAEKAENERIAAEEKAKLAKEKFAKWTELGNKALEARQYEDAEYYFTLAMKLKLDDGTAVDPIIVEVGEVKFNVTDKSTVEKYLTAKRWVNALIAASQPVTRKEVVDGAEYN